MIAPQKLPTRCRAGRWEVLLDCPAVWLPVDSQEHAVAIANAWLQATSIHGVAFEDHVAASLDNAADIFVRYWGQPGLTSRFLRAKAEMARGE